MQVLLFLLVTGALCASVGAQAAEVAQERSDAGHATDSQPTTVSLIELMTSPDRYHGHYVSVAGVAVFRGLDTALFLTTDYARHVSNRYGVWLAVGREWLTEDNEAEFHLHFIEVQGIFDKDIIGHGVHTKESIAHGRRFPGGIKKITRIKRAFPFGG
jgi:hypothetical protein